MNRSTRLGKVRAKAAYEESPSTRRVKSETCLYNGSARWWRYSRYVMGISGKTLEERGIMLSNS